MKNPPLKICFVTLIFATNPYLTLLKEHLKQYNVHVTHLIECSIFFLNKVLEDDIKIVHFHDFVWFQREQRPFRRIPYYFVLVTQLIMLKIRHVKIVISLHNPINKRQKKLLFPYFWAKIIYGLANALIVHYPFKRSELNIPINKKKIHLIPHPNYCGVYKNSVTREEARSRLNLEQDLFIYASVGGINPPKGTLELVQCFGKLHDPNARLIVAGIPTDTDYYEKISHIGRKNKNIIFLKQILPDDELQILMNASDCVVLPYNITTSSGALVLAMSFGKACIAPKEGHFSYLLDEKGAFLYVPDEGSVGLLKAMKEALQKQNKIREMGEYNLNKIKQYDWDTATQQTFLTYTY